MNQLGFPSEVTLQEIAREQTLGGAIDLCRKAAGLEPKQLQSKLNLDKAQWSRWVDGKEGILWPKLTGVMDECGNDAPVLWMNYRRGYDLTSMRRIETELERQNRVLREENELLKHDKRVLTEALRGVVA